VGENELNGRDRLERNNQEWTMQALLPNEQHESERRLVGAPW